MVVDMPPPVLSAPAHRCADDRPQNIAVGDQAVVLYSPDCKWILAYKSETGLLPGSPIKATLAAETAAVADASTGEVIATFEMSGSASVHWLSDGQHLIVNYFAGSDSARPLAITLSHGSGRPVDMSEVVLPDVLKRIGKRQQQVYRYYGYFVADKGDRVVISAEPNYTLRGDAGRGASACLIYSIDKTTFHDARLIERLPDNDVRPCPHNPDEK